MSSVTTTAIAEAVAPLITRIVLLGALLAAVAAGCGGGGEASGTPAAATVELTWVPDAPRGTIATVVGMPDAGAGLAGIEGPARQAKLSTPVTVAFDAAGNLYIAERLNHRVLRVDPSGTVSVAAGVVDEHGWARNGFSGDGGPATEAELYNAHALATGPDGTLYISDSGNNRIRRVDADGIITTVAGSGKRGFSGDGGPATEASLNDPLGLFVDDDGNLYFLDAGNRRIRVVDRHGTIRTIAGNGEFGALAEGWFSPDGTPATELRIGDPTDHMPMGLLLDRDGNLVFTDMGTRRIRMIDAEGRVRTILGNGEAAVAHDGERAAEAPIYDPMDIVLGPDGTLYVTTHSHTASGNLVLAVDGGGKVRKVAGTDTAGYAGEGGPAEQAQLNIPAGLAIGPDGNLYFADARNDVIRMIALP